MPPFRLVALGITSSDLALALQLFALCDVSLSSTLLTIIIAFFLFFYSSFLQYN